MLKKIDALRVKMLNAPLWTALLFLPYFEPRGLGLMVRPMFMVFAVLKAVSILCVLAFFLARPKVSALTVVMGVYQVVLLAGTLINGDEFLPWAYKAGVTAGVCLLVDQCVDTNAGVLIKGVFFTLVPLGLLNLATVLLTNAGVPGMRYLFEIDNAHALFLVPAMGAAAVYGNQRKWPYIAQLGLMLVLASALYINWSVTGMLAMAAFIALFLLYKVRKSYYLCNIYVYYAVIVVMFLAVVVFQLPDRFSYIIENVLHKSLTLSGRLPLWTRAMALIGDKPLLGHGKLSNAAVNEILGQPHCHNIILQALFDGGVVGLAVFLVQMGVLARPLWRTRSTVNGYMLAAAVFSLLVYCTAEGQLFPMPYTCLFMLAYHVEKFGAGDTGGGEGQ